MPFLVCVEGDFVWLLSSTFASVAIEVVPLLEGGTIVEAQIAGEASTDGASRVDLPILIGFSGPAKDFAGLGGVAMTVGDDDRRGEEEMESKGQQKSPGTPKIPAVGV